MKPYFNKEESKLLRILSDREFTAPRVLCDGRLPRMGIYTPFGDIFTYFNKGILITGDTGHGKTTLVNYFKEKHPKNVEINS